MRKEEPIHLIIENNFKRRYNKNLSISDYTKIRSHDKTFKCYSNEFIFDVNFKNILNFELRTRHFNIDILADKIHETILSYDLEEYEYCIERYNDLTKQIFKEFRETITFHIDLKECFFNPVKKQYKILLETADYTVGIKKFEFIYIGEPSFYKFGTLLEEIKREKIIKCNELKQPSDSIFFRSIRKVFLDLNLVPNLMNDRNLLKLFYRQQQNDYIVKIEIKTIKCELEYSYDEITNNDLKEKLFEKYPEVIV